MARSEGDREDKPYDPPRQHVGVRQERRSEQNCYAREPQYGFELAYEGKRLLRRQILAALLGGTGLTP